MSKATQVSATISSSTKEKLDRFTKRHGLKKSHVMEQALLLFMESRRDLPEEAFIPSRFVLEDRAFAALLERLAKPSAPTKALRRLMNASDG